MDIISQKTTNFICNNEFLCRVSPLWSSKSHQKKYVGSPQYSDAPVYRRYRSQKTTTGAPGPIISRVSRVMQTDSSDTLLPPPSPPPAAALRLLPEQQKLPDEETVVRVYQVSAAVTTAISFSSSVHKQATGLEPVT
jgi:hypothetical protein